MGNFAAQVKAFWARPFNAQGSALQWFLFLGLLIVIIIAWNTILRFITE
jgi:hypothetical protein